MADELFIQQPRVLALAILFPLYFVVWIAIAVGSWAFFRRREPEAKWRFRTTVSLVSGVVIGGYLVVLAALMGGWLAGLIFAIPTIPIIYVSAMRTTLCHQCGKGGVVSFSRDWGYCSKCGERLRPPAPVASLR